MKNLLFAALLVGASVVEVAAQAPVLANDPAPTQAGKNKKRKYTPELYKGTVAKQRRIVTDAPGAQKDTDDDAASTKGDKSSKKQ